MPPSVLTIGHSNHPLDGFLALLAQHKVKVLVDIRRFPGSRKHPHFNQDNLVAALMCLFGRPSSCGVHSRDGQQLDPPPGKSV